MPDPSPVATPGPRAPAAATKSATAARPKVSKERIRLLGVTPLFVNHSHESDTELLKTYPVTGDPAYQAILKEKTSSPATTIPVAGTAAAGATSSAGASSAPASAAASTAAVSNGSAIATNSASASSSSSAAAAGSTTTTAAAAVVPETEHVKWVGCEKCAKWRRVPKHMDEKSLPSTWTCALNTWDPKHNSCSVPQEPLDDHELWPGMPHEFIATAKREDWYILLIKHLFPGGVVPLYPTVVDDKAVDLYSLYHDVVRLGGHAKVTNERKWSQVAAMLSVATTPQVVSALAKFYTTHLASYEAHTTATAAAAAAAAASSAASANGRSKRTNAGARSKRAGSDGAKTEGGTARPTKKAKTAPAAVSVPAASPPPLSVNELTGAAAVIAPKIEAVAASTPVASTSAGGGSALTPAAAANGTFDFSRAASAAGGGGGGGGAADASVVAWLKGFEQRMDAQLAAAMARLDERVNSRLAAVEESIGRRVDGIRSQITFIQTDIKRQMSVYQTDALKQADLISLGVTQLINDNLAENESRAAPPATAAAAAAPATTSAAAGAASVT